MNTETLLFVLTTLMVLVTLAAAYLGLRLYKRNQWVRLAIICVPMLVNALLFIIYSNDNFLYLGLVLLLCIPFVWPRKSA